MSNITEESISQCSLTLGKFDSETVNLLVKLFHRQNTCSKLILLSNNLKEKFESLLTTKMNDDKDDEKNNDTPLTRIELAVMIHFKEKYLSELMITDDNKQLNADIRFSIDNELNLAYCYLLSLIDDRLSEDDLDHLKFLLKIRSPVNSLFEMYTNSGQNVSNFIGSLIGCNYFKEKLVIMDQTMRAFQLFIKRYEDFLCIFQQNYKLLDNESNSTQTDAIISQTDLQDISLFAKEVSSSNVQEKKSPIVLNTVLGQNLPESRVNIQQSIIKPTSNVPKKGLCVIINITKFLSSHSIDTPERKGSEMDVELIKIIFNKLKFTTLECKFDFKKVDLDSALDHINDGKTYGDFDCLVMFIMSHGLLHSFFTADSKEIVIRDIIMRYSDSSTKNIWFGKSRLFFIQACRSPWPENMQSNKREGVNKNDLSPKMLVAYSCSPSEASKRSPKTGSSFIQIFCIMLFRYSHFFDIHNILKWTSKFVTTRDECLNQISDKPVSIQRPGYIGPGFSTNFRFSNHSLCDMYSSWSAEQQGSLKIPISIWREIYDLVFNNPVKNH